MEHSDFVYIQHFTSDEVVDTGASLEDVKYMTIHALDRVRGFIDQPIHLVKNGLTSGKHNSSLHLKGLAVDFTVGEYLTHTEAVKVAMYGVMVGFNGIGVYWNGRCYSFHFDMRKELGTWFGTKNESGGWKYSGLKFNGDR